MWTFIGSYLGGKGRDDDEGGRGDKNSGGSSFRSRGMSGVSGYLWKMKRSPRLNPILPVPQWNKRWFTIEGRKLKWYESESSARTGGEEAERGVVELKNITGVSRFEPGNRGTFSFIVCCPDRNLLLRASSAPDMDKWIRAIQTQADRARGGSGMGVITGLFPTLAQRRVKQKPLPTLEKELDRIVQRLNYLENEIVLSEEDIRLQERSDEGRRKQVPSALRSELETSRDEDLTIRIAGSRHQRQSGGGGSGGGLLANSGSVKGPNNVFVPRQYSEPAKKTTGSALADLLPVDFTTSDYEYSDENEGEFLYDSSSADSTPVRLTQGGGSGSVRMTGIIKNHAWTTET